MIARNDDDNEEILGDLDDGDGFDAARPGRPTPSTDTDTTPLDYGRGPHDEVLGDLGDDDE